MSAVRPWRRIGPELFAFATTDRRDLYIAIMAVFEDAAVLRPSMSFEQIRAGLVERGWDEPLEHSELDRALGQLVGWRLLEVTQDHSAPYATPEEFERRNLNWSLTPQGVAAIAGLLRALEVLRQAVSLQPATLDAIADGLADLHDLAANATPDPARIATRLAEVEAHMTSLVSNVRQFGIDLQRLMREEATNDEVFLVVKERTVTYLQEFVSGVERPMRRVANGVARIEAFGVAALLDRALAGANLAPVAGEDPAPGWLTERAKRWAALRAWFAPENASEPRIRSMMHVARQAILQLLRVLERRWEGRRRAASLPQDFRALAGWFAGAGSEGDAHRLFNAAFGLWPARHAHLRGEDDEAVASTTSWLEAPPVLVAPSLRTSGSVQQRGRAAPIPDPALVRARRQAEQAAALARRQDVRERLRTDGVLRLSAFGLLDSDAFRELLGLLGQALFAPLGGDGARRAVTADGQVEVVLRAPSDGRVARLETDAGVMHGPDAHIEIAILGVDLLEGLALGAVGRG